VEVSYAKGNTIVSVNSLSQNRTNYLLAPVNVTPLLVKKLLVALLSILVISLPAHAGSYAVTYTFTSVGTGPGTATQPTSGTNTTRAPFVSNSGTVNTISLTVTATLTYKPSSPADDATMASVVVSETGGSGVSLPGVRGPSPYTASASDGMGDPSIFVTPPAGTTGPLGASSNGTHYTIYQGAPTITLPTRTATWTTTLVHKLGSCSYSATVTPVVLSVSGTIYDTSGQLHTIIGQGSTGSLTAGSYPLANYQWSVPGDTFASFWTAPAYPPSKPAKTSGFVTYVSAATWSTANPHWYWSDNSGNWGSSLPLDVTCTAVASDPSGNVIGPVSADVRINLWAPTASIKNAMPGPSSYMEYSTGAVYGIASTPDSSTNGEGPGIKFDITAMTPALFPPGDLKDAQLVSWDIWGTGVFGGWTDFLNTNGYALDSVYPDTDWGVANGFSDLGYSDSPSEPFPGGFASTTSSINIENQFKHFTYFAPQGTDVQPVPIWEVDWNWLCSANDSAGAWNPNPPGQTSIVSARYNSYFPTWTSLWTPTGVY